MQAMSEEAGYVDHVLQWLHTVNKSGRLVDFDQPFVRPSLSYVYPLFVFLYTTVGAIGVTGNAAMLVVISRRRLFHDHTFFLMGNLALSNLIKCICSMPITLANLLIQNWLFGSFICFFLPMLQTFPAHCSFLTFLMIAIDRYRQILHPFKSRLPAGLCVIAVWVASVCTVLPFAIYIKYFNLGATLGPDFDGVGICVVANEERIEEYIRALFVTLYVMPLAVIAFLFVRISAELKSREATTISIHFAAPNSHSHSLRGSSGGSSSGGHGGCDRLGSGGSSSSTAAAARELIDHACKASGTWSTTSQHLEAAAAMARAEARGGGAASSQRLDISSSSSAGGLGEDLHHQLHPHRGERGGHSHHHHHHHHHSHHHPHSHHKGSTDSEGGGGGRGARGSGGERSSSTGGGGGGILRNGNGGSVGGSEGSPGRDSAVRIRSYAATERSTQDSDDDLDLNKEKRTQNYLITMVTVFAMCWCPVNILILVTYFVHENDSNESSYDITFMTFTWFAYLSTCTTPVLFASWMMSNATKDRLRGYFRFSNRRHTHGGAEQRRHFQQKQYMSRSSCCNIFEEQMIMDSRNVSHDGEHV